MFRYPRERLEVEISEGEYLVDELEAYITQTEKDTRENFLRLKVTDWHTKIRREKMEDTKEYTALGRSSFQIRIPRHMLARVQECGYTPTLEISTEFMQQILATCEKARRKRVRIQSIGLEAVQE